MTIYRQGDVLITRLEAEPEGARKPVAREGGRIVLAHGELTGHAHAIESKAASLFSDPASLRRFLRVRARDGVELRHEEHTTIKIEKGIYEITRQVEWDGVAGRQVAD